MFYSVEDLEKAKRNVKWRDLIQNSKEILQVMNRARREGSLSLPEFIKVIDSHICVCKKIIELYEEEDPVNTWA